MLEFEAGFLNALRVKVEGEIHFIVHGGHEIDGELVYMNLFFRELILLCFIDSFAAVNKEVSYGVHEALRVFDMWPVFGFLEGVYAAAGKVSDDDRAIVRLDVGGAGATDK